MLDAACRLGPRPVLLAAWHRAPPFPAPPALPAGHAAAVLAQAVAVTPGDWHGPFAAGTPALALDLFGPGDIRPIWERNRWAELPLLAQAARLEPAAGHAARAEAWLAAWLAANPPFRGPNWACGQEAALRGLHLALALALLGGEPPAGARRLLALHGRRIAATPAYALAQDNNHTISEAAGLWVCGLHCGEAGWVGQGRARLDAAIRRLVAPDGGFAQLSTGYHRLLLDVLSMTAWLTALPRFAAAGWVASASHFPGVASQDDRGPAGARAAAAVEWLRRVTDPATGATPRLGHQDGSAFADLSLAGPDDTRPSLERAARLLAGRSAGLRGDPGCAWLGLPEAPPPPALPARWASTGLMGWSADGARALLRTGPLRFRPGHADLLHLDLWDGSVNLLRDGGTGAYNPAAEASWWHAHLSGTAGHNTVAFDGADQMPRVSRFLFAQWPRTGRLPEGAWLRDCRGNRQERVVRVKGRCWRVEDRLSGPFRVAVLRWRLAPAAWRATPDGAESPLARLRITADAPLDCRLELGWESPGYGAMQQATLLVARVRAPVHRIESEILLPNHLQVE